MDKPVYLDCAATTMVDTRVADVAIQVMTEAFGNAGSRTHLYGSQAKAIVESARSQVAAAAGCEPNDVIFTSGATESNNLSILGAFKEGPTRAKCHVITTDIEHKAVIEPICELERRGFQVTRLRPDQAGFIRPEAISHALRDETALISIMHVNNETGVIQPIDQVANLLQDHPALLHVDAAQGFTKDNRIYAQERIDLISISGHKINAPKGIGALVVRSRRGALPLESLTYGGGQERGLRPGTLPVHLIAALGAAAEIGTSEHQTRRTANLAFRANLRNSLAPLEPFYLGDQEQCIPNIVSFSVDQVDSEAFILATKDEIAVSNGSACTSHSYEPSYVLAAMGVDEERRRGAVRLSWSHETREPDWQEIVRRIQQLR